MGVTDMGFMGIRTLALKTNKNCCTYEGGCSISTPHSLH